MRSCCFEVFDEGLQPYLLVYCGSTLAWSVFGKTGDTEITIPTLPDGAADVIRCPSPLTATLRLMDLDETRYFASRCVGSEAITLIL